ncbi:MAG: histidinol-phosphate transaminase [Synergistales bacterium]
MSWKSHIVRKSLSGIEPYRPGKPIAEVQRELGLQSAIRLCSNENPWPLPERVVEAVRLASGETCRYPDPASYRLKRAIAMKWGRSPSEVIVGGGTEGILYSLFQSIIDEGDEVAYAVPTYPLYGLAAAAAGAKRIEVETGETEGKTGLDRLIEACGPRTKALVVCNPNNPTGSILTRTDLTALANSLNGRETLLILDEAYADYVEDPKYASGIDLFDQLGNIVMLRTFSKIYGLAALRVGYAIAPKPVVETYLKVRKVFEVNSIAQNAALAALSETAYIQEVREKTLAERERLSSALREMGIRVHPTQTNFIILDFQDAKTVYENLLLEGIIVRLGDDLGYPGHLRVTVGLPEENDRFLQSLGKVLKRLAGR